MYPILSNSFIRFNGYNLVISLLSILAFSSLIPQRSLAQQVPFCYMENAQGSVIDLSTICGVKPTVLTSQTVSSQNSGEASLQITQKELEGFASVYAHQYCDWREAGGRSRDESNKNAISKLTDIIFRRYGIDGMKPVIAQLDVTFFQNTDKLIERTCPKNK